MSICAVIALCLLDTCVEKPWFFSRYGELPWGMSGNHIVVVWPMLCQFLRVSNRELLQASSRAWISTAHSFAYFFVTVHGV